MFPVSLNQLQFNPNNEVLFSAQQYCDIGEGLLAGQLYFPPNLGRAVSNTTLFKMAIDRDPAFARAYIRLAETLGRKESTQLLNKQQVTKHDLCLTAIHLDPECLDCAWAYVEIGLYMNRSKIESIQLLNGLFITEKEAYLKAIQNDPELPTGYIRLAITMTPNETIKLPNSTEGAKQVDLLLKTLQLYPECYDAFFMLGVAISCGEKVMFDGQPMSQEDCYVKAISINPNREEAFINLGDITAVNGLVELESGEILTKEICFKMAANLNPSCSSAYIGIAQMMSSEEEITQLFDGRELTKQQCFCEAVRVDPRNAEALAYYGTTLPLANSIVETPDESMGVDEELPTTLQEACLRALVIDPSCAFAHLSLAKAMSASDRYFVNERVMTQRDFLLKAAELDPSVEQELRNYLSLIVSPRGPSQVVQQLWQRQANNF